MDGRKCWAAPAVGESSAGRYSGGRSPGSADASGKGTVFSLKPCNCSLERLNSTLKAVNHGPDHQDWIRGRTPFMFHVGTSTLEALWNPSTPNQLI